MTIEMTAAVPKEVEQIRSARENPNIAVSFYRDGCRGWQISPARILYKKYWPDKKFTEISVVVSELPNTEIARYVLTEFFGWTTFCDDGNGKLPDRFTIFIPDGVDGDQP